MIISLQQVVDIQNELIIEFVDLKGLKIKDY
jgi:hypothetical protein